MKNLTLLFGLLMLNIATCRDFYVGMFKDKDLLVASDRLYKPRAPHRLQYAKYGRHFKCKITYFRVIDRLGYGPGPRVRIIRGGLQKNFLVLRLSAFNSPISVNIYVGCANKLTTTTVATTTTKANATQTTPSNATVSNVTEAVQNTSSTEPVDSNSTSDANATETNTTAVNATNTNAAGTE